jgi:phage tail-like protein
MPEARHDPYLNFNFLVQIDGDTLSGATEVDLPEGRIEIATYREGGERSNASRRLPGDVKFGPLVLRRGFSGDRALFQWWRNVAEGNLDRRNVVVLLRDQRGQEVARWAFQDCVPTKYSGPSFNARGNEIAIESIELDVEDMELET